MSMSSQYLRKNSEGDSAVVVAVVAPEDSEAGLAGRSAEAGFV